MNWTKDPELVEGGCEGLDSLKQEDWDTFDSQALVIALSCDGARVSLDIWPHAYVRRLRTVPMDRIAQAVEWLAQEIESSLCLPVAETLEESIDFAEGRLHEYHCVRVAARAIGLQQGKLIDAQPEGIRFNAALAAWEKMLNDERAKLALRLHEKEFSEI